MANELGASRLTLTVDTKDFDARIDAARRKTSGLGDDADAAFQKATGGVSRAATSLIKYVRGLGASTEQQRLFNAAAAGVPTEIIDAARRAMDAHAKSIADATAQQQRLNAAQTAASAGNANVSAIQQRLLNERAASEALARARDDLIRTQHQMNAAASVAANANITAKLIAEREATAALASARQTLISNQHADNANAAAAAHDRMRNALIAERDATAQAAKSKADFVDGLRRETTAIGKSRSDMLELAAAERGVTKEAAPFIAAIRAQEQALAKQSGQLKENIKEFNKYGLSAKQQVAAMRGVPAQVTDIFVSLQGGQNPLTVLLQQGGQLKDMFGGIAPAARALGGALLGLVNPYTVAAAAAGLLVVAVVSGEQRINAFNRALILTGQSVTTSADDLQRYAEQLDQIGGNTSREAADALAQIASNGIIAADNYKLVAEAALAMERATGQAFDKTIQAYADLARDPVTAILKLNESEHFLTEAVYARIKALQDSGQVEAAATLATETYAGVQIERAEAVEESLGLVTGAWHSIKNATGEAWDEASNYFANLDRDAKDAAGTLARLWAGIKMPGPAGAFGMAQALAPPDTGSGPGSTTAAENEIVNSRRKRELADMLKASRTAQQVYDQELEKIKNLGATEVEQLQLRTAAKKRFDAAMKSGAGPKGDGGVANAGMREQLQGIKDAMAQEQAAISANRSILQAEYSAKLITVQDYYARTRDLMQQGTTAEETALKAQLDVLRSRVATGKDSINVSREIGQVEAALTKVRQEAAAADKVLSIQEDAVMQARTLGIAEYARNLDESNKTAQESIAAAIARVRLGDQEADRLERIAQLTRDYNKAQAELNATLAQNPIDGLAVYEANSNKLKESFDQAVSDAKAGFAGLDAAKANWMNGVSAGMANWIADASNVAGQVATITTNALDGIADAFAQLAITGKASFKSLLVGILSDISKFMAKQAVLQFLKAFVVMDGSGNFMGFKAGTTTFAAKGGVFDGSAGLSAFSGQVVNKPTPFKFAKGAGIMGEAGPEAIMPLKRGADGKLGVQVAGGGAGSGGVTIYVQTNVTTGETNTKVEGNDEAQYKEFAQLMKQISEETVQRSMRPGGLLWKAGVSA